MKRFVAAILLFALLLIAPGTSYAAVCRAQAQITKGSIQVQGFELNQTNADYPMLTYKGVLYYPLGYHAMRLLGYDTQWSKEKGLVVSPLSGEIDWTSSERQIQIPGQYLPVQKNRTPIQLNGEKYTAPDPHPYLVFRGLRYFPLSAEVLKRLDLVLEQDEKGIRLYSKRELTFSERSRAAHLVSRLNALHYEAAYSFQAEVTDQKGEMVEYNGRKKASIKDGRFHFDTEWKNLKTTIGVNPVTIERINLHYDPIKQIEAGPNVQYTASGALKTIEASGLTELAVSGLTKRLYRLEFVKAKEKKPTVELLRVEEHQSVWKVSFPSENLVYEVVTTPDPQQKSAVQIHMISFADATRSYRIARAEK